MAEIGLKAGRPSARQPSISLTDLKEDTVRLNVDIDKSLHKKLKLRAVEEERSIALIVRELLEKALSG
jgi:predicted HicB family RNase H-like nuclease